MKKSVKIGLAAAIALPILAVAAIPVFVDANTFRPYDREPAHRSPFPQGHPRRSQPLRHDRKPGGERSRHRRRPEVRPGSILHRQTIAHWRCR